MNYQRTGFGFGGPLTPAIKNLIFANGIIFLMQFLNQSLNGFILNLFALQPYQVIFEFKIWQVVSYMFLHGDLMHILFNMFFLWMFGSEIEMEWGTRQFLKYYFICGIGAGLLMIITSPGAFTIGASGAVYGIMVAYAIRNPDRPIYLYFLFPIKVKYFIGFMAIVSFLSTMNASSDGIAHAAHLGGMVIGFIYLKYWHKIYSLKNIFQQPGRKQKLNRTQVDDEKVDYYRRKIDELLDKINRVGYLKLSDDEKELLEEGSKYLREHDNQDIN